MIVKVRVLPQIHFCIKLLNIFEEDQSQVFPQIVLLLLKRLIEFILSSFVELGFAVEDGG